MPSAVAYATVTVCRLAGLRLTTNANCPSSSSPSTPAIVSTGSSPPCRAAQGTRSVAAAEVVPSRLAVALLATPLASTSACSVV